MAVDKWEMAQGLCGGPVGERSGLMDSAHLSPCCPACEKREIAVVSEDARESQSEEVESK